MRRPLQQKYLGKFLCYFTSDIGELDHVVALWGYDSLDERDRARSTMMADPQWQAFLEKVTDLIDVQKSLH